MFARIRTYALIAIAGYLAIAGGMWTFQRSFLYVPAPGYLDPGSHNLPQASRIDLKADDGTPLVGWWIARKSGEARVYLYFHGNADGLDRRAARFGLLASDGSGVLALSYRGYGGSGGSPSEAVLHADALSIYRHLRETVPAHRIVIFGESLGTGVSLNLARQVEAKAVVLDSPYYSVLRRAQATYPWLPVAWLLTDTFRSDLWISDVDEPVLILHGTADDLIPPRDSAELLMRAKPGKVMRRLYDDQPHVVPLNKGPMPDILTFLAGVP